MQGKFRESLELVNDIYEKTPRLRSAILFFLNRLPEKLNRSALCKYLYYADGHFYQKSGYPLFEVPFLHGEDAPEPLFINEIFHKMIQKGELEIVPFVKTVAHEGKPITVLQGMVLRTRQQPADIFTREEKKVLTSIALTLAGDLSLETRYFPQLYQHYTGTGLYELIPHMVFPKGRRPHLSFKAWARKIFRLMWQ
ncbi:MAG: Panacea domain-containing protein [Leptospiraceae bacterium]|nr:Panacea domain-containing protein [Leptospiraceae bacterium]MDW8306409.1 hypothetical protein [Leptospiraceae bacterium]